MPNLVSSFVVIYHCNSERSVLAVQIGPFRWVKFSPIFGGSCVAPLIRAFTVQLAWADLDPRAEMSPIVQSSDWIAPGESESDFVLQRWIDFWGSRQQQIFLFFSADYPLRSFTIDLHPLICRVL